MTLSPAIETLDLRKEFGSKVAVTALNLRVERGEVFGFLGPNGAGKTTAVKMLLGLVGPTSGQAWILGAPLGAVEVRSRVGFLPEHFRFHEWLTAREFLQLHADLYRIPGRRAAARIESLLEVVGLDAHRNKRLQAFSKGMLQRIGLAQALLNEPEIVFLDEPTSGLDPVGRRLVRDLIRELRDRGATVFLNSHLLSEVEITCDRVAFIKRGEVVRISDLHGLVDGELKVDVRARKLSAEILEGLAELTRTVRADGEHLQLTVRDESSLPAIHRYLHDQGAEVYSFTPQTLSLEELFLDIVGMDGGL